MRHARGFTIVELVVVISILTILSVLAVAGISQNQRNARDAERTIDAEAIATSLERYYDDGSVDRYTNFPTKTTYQGGSYPPQDVASSATFLKNILPGLPADAAKFSFASTSGFRVDSFVGDQRVDLPDATNRINSQTGVGNITYQPIAVVGGQRQLCNNTTQDCRAFRLYYRKEVGNELVVIESRHQ